MTLIKIWNRLSCLARRERANALSADSHAFPIMFSHADGSFFFFAQLFSHFRPFFSRLFWIRVRVQTNNPCPSFLDFFPPSLDFRTKPDRESWWDWILAKNTCSDFFCVSPLNKFRKGEKGRKRSKTRSGSCFVHLDQNSRDRNVLICQLNHETLVSFWVFVPRTNDTFRHFNSARALRNWISFHKPSPQSASRSTMSWCYSAITRPLSFHPNANWECSRLFAALQPQ